MKLLCDMMSSDLTFYLLPFNRQDGSHDSTEMERR